MAVTRDRTQSILSALKDKFSIPEFIRRQSPKPDAPFPPSIKPIKRISSKALDNYWKILIAQTAVDDADRDLIADTSSLRDIEAYGNNIESFIGTLKVPLGVIGPMRVNGIFAQGDYYIPLATTEATLVASYARGARLLNDCGGCTAGLLNDGLCRAPGFAFRTMTEAGLFVEWLIGEYDTLKAVAEETTRFGRLVDLRTHMEANHIYLSCEFSTGDAAGQNMTTIATQALCSHIITHTPVKPEYWFLESNFSGDKKASALSFTTVRGKKVSAEVLIPGDIVEKWLHTTPAAMHNFWRMSALGGVMSGTIGIQGHYANGLTALYLATGQDTACAAESSVGITRLELWGGDLYAAVTLPNIVVGTVGGGTKLPAQNAGLKILGLSGSGHAHALAEICAALCLAGELSLIGAFSAGQFSEAHQSLARG